MENRASSKRQKDDIIDPIGIGLILDILSISISILNTVHQFGLLSRKDKMIQEEFKKLREQTLRLHNRLDDLLLIFEIYGSYEGNDVGSLDSKKLTISDTLIKLKEKDYLRWLDIQYSLHMLGQECYSLISNIRELSQNYPKINEVLNPEIFVPFDKLFMNFSSYGFGDFVTQFRKALDQLQSTLAELTHLRDNRE